MAVRSQRPGLTWAIFGITAVALVVLVLTLLVVVPAQADRYLSAALADHGRAVAKEVERKISVGARPAIDPEASAELNAIVATEFEVSAAWVLVCPERQCQPRDIIAATSTADPTATQEALAGLNSGADWAQPLPSGLMLTSLRVMPRTGVGAGFIVVTMVRTKVAEALSSLRRTLLLALLVTVAIFIALIGVISRVLLIRAHSRHAGAWPARLSEADLSGRISSRRRHARAERAGRRGPEQHRSGAARHAGPRARRRRERGAGHRSDLSRSAASTSSRPALDRAHARRRDLDRHGREMLASLKGIAENVETLFQAAPKTRARAFSEMATTNDEVAAERDEDGGVGRARPPAPSNR
jgi:hypothetical protein